MNREWGIGNENEYRTAEYRISNIEVKEAQAR